MTWFVHTEDSSALLKKLQFSFLVECIHMVHLKPTHLEPKGGVFWLFFLTCTSFSGNGVMVKLIDHFVFFLVGFSHCWTLRDSHLFLPLCKKAIYYTVLYVLGKGPWHFVYSRGSCSTFSDVKMESQQSQWNSTW